MTNSHECHMILIGYHSTYAYKLYGRLLWAKM